MQKGYLIAPISKKEKTPAIKDFKNYSYDRAFDLIKTNYFTNKSFSYSIRQNTLLY